MPQRFSRVVRERFVRTGLVLLSPTLFRYFAGRAERREIKRVGAETSGHQASPSKPLAASV